MSYGDEASEAGVETGVSVLALRQGRAEVLGLKLRGGNSGRRHRRTHRSNRGRGSTARSEPQSLVMLSGGYQRPACPPHPPPYPDGIERVCTLLTWASAPCRETSGGLMWYDLAVQDVFLAEPPDLVFTALAALSRALFTWAERPVRLP